jgi:hypothetical protein
MRDDHESPDTTESIPTLLLLYPSRRDGVTQNQT